MNVSGAYMASEDAKIVEMVKADAGPTEIAGALGRNANSVAVRICKLREQRLLPRADLSKGGSRKLAKGHSTNIDFSPAIRLDGDHEVVRACRREGGFPRAVVQNGKTFWIRPDGGEWRHIREPLRFMWAAA